MGLWDTLVNVAQAAGEVAMELQMLTPLHNVYQSDERIRGAKVVNVTNKGATAYLLKEEVKKGFFEDEVIKKSYVLFLDKKGNVQLVPSDQFDRSQQADVIACPNCGATYLNLERGYFYECKECGVRFEYLESGVVRIAKEPLIALILAAVVREYGGLTKEREDVLAYINNAITLDITPYFKAGLKSKKSFTDYIEHFASNYPNKEERGSLVKMAAMMLMTNVDERNAKSVLLKVSRTFGLPTRFANEAMEFAKSALSELGIELRKSHKKEVSEEEFRKMLEEILDSYRDDVGDMVFIAPEIPADKLDGALSSYASGANRDAVLLLADDTFWGGAGDGVLVTVSKLFFSTKFSDTKHIDLELINDIEAKGSDLYINGVKMFNATLIPEKDLKVIAHFINDIADLVKNYTIGAPEQEPPQIENATKQIEHKEEAPKSPAESKQNDELMERMQKLQKLYDGGLISKEEYEAKRKEILDSI